MMYLLFHSVLTLSYCAHYFILYEGVFLKNEKCAAVAAFVDRFWISQRLLNRHSIVYQDYYCNLYDINTVFPQNSTAQRSLVSPVHIFTFFRESSRGFFFILLLFLLLSRFLVLKHKILLFLDRLKHSGQKMDCSFHSKSFSQKVWCFCEKVNDKNFNTFRDQDIIRKIILGNNNFLFARHFEPK